MDSMEILIEYLFDYYGYERAGVDVQYDTYYSDSDGDTFWIGFWNSDLCNLLYKHYGCIPDYVGYCSDTSSLFAEYDTRECVQIIFEKLTEDVTTNEL